MDIKELKAKAYDILANIQHLQVQLEKTNQQIAIEASKPKDEKMNESMENGKL